MSKTISIPSTTAIFAAYGLDALNTELKARSLETTKDAKVGAMILASGCRSLDEFSATIINLSTGTIDAETLREKMVKAFPQHKIGERHGPHYLSLARNGNLNGNVNCRFQPEKSTRKARKGIVMDVSSMNEKQRKELARVLRPSNPSLADSILNYTEEKTAE